MSTKDNTTIQSEMISFLRFPLIVLVVCIHCDIFPGGDCSSFFNTSTFLIADVLARIAVPALFLISGFLFFNNTQFSISTYIEKNKRRIKTLLVPYLIWNSLLLILLAIKQPETVFDDCKSIFDKIGVIISAYWNYNSTRSPISGPLWYIRDLMILNLLSPLIFVSVKKDTVGQIVVSFLLLAWILFGDAQVHYFNISAFAFYSAGAYLGIHRKNLAEIVRKIGRIPYLYVPLVIIECLIRGNAFYHYFHNVTLLFGVLLAFRIAWLIVKKNTHTASHFFPGASFFVFLVHDPWCLSIAKRVVNAILSGSSSFYIPCVIMTILIALSLFLAAKRFIPKLTSIMIGSR